MSRGAQGVSLKCKYPSHPFSSDLTLYTTRCCFRLIKAQLWATRLQNKSAETSWWTLDHLQLFSRCPASGVFHRKEENLHPFLWFKDFSMLHCHVSTVAQKGQTKHWLHRGPFRSFFYIAGETRCVESITICNLSCRCHCILHTAAFKESHVHHFYWIQMLKLRVKKMKGF